MTATLGAGSIATNEPRDHLPPLDPRLAELLARTARAKRMAGAMYSALGERMPGAAAQLGLRHLAEDEEAHAAALEDILGKVAANGAQGQSGLVGCNPRAESWASGLMAAFALDQASTASFIALATASDERIAGLSRRLLDDESAHQTYAIGAFRTLARDNPSVGLPLAKEMIADRDWVKELYPRRAALVELAEAGLIATDAPKQHDTFLASLGDRIQDALGVLGYL